MKVVSHAALLVLIGLVGCKETPKRMVDVPSAEEDAPPAVTIENVPTTGTVSKGTVVLNGVQGEATASKSESVSVKPTSAVFFVVKAENQLGGVKSLKAKITQGTDPATAALLFTGNAQNVAEADGKVPTTLSVWGTQTALGPMAFLATIGLPVHIEAVAENFTGGVSTLKETVFLWESGGGHSGPYIGGYVDSGNSRSGSSSSGCTGNPPTGACMVRTPEGCEVPGKYACVSGKYECQAKPNVDYCTTCGMQGSLNCGTCQTSVCLTTADCAPGTICALDASAGPGIKTCQVQNMACPLAKCWLPKNLNYDRNKCFAP